jgi:hypothetical protein
MSIEAMKQALDALEEHGTHYARHEDDYIKAITALRQAIEFQEMVKKGTKAWADTPDNWVDDLRGGAKIEAWYDPTNHVVSTDKNDPRFTPLGQLWRLVPEREWVGLTDEERKQVRSGTNYNQFMTAGEYAEAVQKATEDELKEKNK